MRCVAYGGAEVVHLQGSLTCFILVFYANMALKFSHYYGTSLQAVKFGGEEWVQQSCLAKLEARNEACQHQS